MATRTNQEILQNAGLECTMVNKVSEGSPHIVDLVKNDEISLIISSTEDTQGLEDADLDKDEQDEWQEAEQQEEQCEEEAEEEAEAEAEVCRRLRPHPGRAGQLACRKDSRLVVGLGLVPCIFMA